MYNQHRIYRVFQLINQLQAGPAKSSGSLAKMLGVTVRSVYRYLDLLEQLGFRVEKDAHGKFFLAASGIYGPTPEGFTADGSTPEGAAGQPEPFTPQESAYLAQLVLATGRDHPLAEGVLLKVLPMEHSEGSELAALDPAVLEVGARMVFRAHLAKAVEALSYAIQHKRQVVLRGYYSANSQTQSDRRVEPQCFTDNFATLSAYEPTSGTNKYFRVERISAVEVLPDAMEHEEKHAYFKPDVFGFQGQHEPLQVEWTMTLRASLLLQEEYPMSRALVVPADEPGRYRFSATVYSYKGPGRFVLGFLDDVDVTGSDGFRKYLRGVARRLF
jgi:predicted DNA-binding transcriptional regulator YafY